MEVVGPRKPTLALPLPLPRQVCGAAEGDTTDTGAGVDAGEVELHILYTGGALLSYVRQPELACWSWS